MATPKNIRRVLIVEDDASIRRVASMALSRVGGWHTLQAADGPTALTMARDEDPDLIILDVMLPGMDGPQTLWALRRDDATTHIPVIFMTARVQSHERAQYTKLGALGVIPKPFDAMKLPEQIAEIWRDHYAGPGEPNLPEGDTRRGASASPPHGPSPSDADATLTGHFASVLPRRVAELTAATDDALDNAATDAARSRAVGLAHQLAGSAGTFGAPNLGTLAGELERALRDGDDDSARDALARLALDPRAR